MEFHKTQLRKHKAELKALKKHVLKSFLQQIDHRQTVESPVFVPSQEHILRIWKYYSETQYNTYNESWRNLFRVLFFYFFVIFAYLFLYCFCK